jgi:hypothetical protein
MHNGSNPICVFSEYKVANGCAIESFASRDLSKNWQFRRVKNKEVFHAVDDRLPEDHHGAYKERTEEQEQCDCWLTSV